MCPRTGVGCVEGDFGGRSCGSHDDGRRFEFQAVCTAGEAGFLKRGRGSGVITWTF